MGKETRRVGSKSASEEADARRRGRAMITASAGLGRDASEDWVGEKKKIRRNRTGWAGRGVVGLLNYRR